MPDITAARPVSGTPIETGWGDQVHDAIEGIQSGKGTSVFSNAADGSVVAVVFPRAYTAPPVVLVAPETSLSRAVVAKVVLNSITTTGFSFQGQDTGGGLRTGNLPCHWIAIGTPA